MRIRSVANYLNPFLFIIVCVAAAVSIAAQSQRSATPAPSSGGVEIAFLGTGTPVPNADRQGPSLAIVVNGKAYLVDSGSGVLRQANSIFQRGIPALRPAELDIAFLTHLHSDHTLGLPDLIFTPWIQERTKPLRLYGPEGTKEMAAHILEAFREDIHVRTTGLEGGNTTGYKVDAHDVQPGNIYPGRERHREGISCKARFLEGSPGIPLRRSRKIHRRFGRHLAGRVGGRGLFRLRCLDSRSVFRKGAESLETFGASRAMDEVRK